MIKITSIRRTCIACPSQWEGVSDDGRTVIIRYRHGYLSVSYMNPSESENCRYDLEEVFERELFAEDFVYGEDYSDSRVEDFTTVRMILSKAGVLDFPENLEIAHK
jgi:hypothetical protein